MKQIFLLLSFIAYTVLLSPSVVLGQIKKQPVLGYRSATILSISGLQFKDLNRNNQLDKYEDWRLPYSIRAKDLLKKMTVEEKAGFMLISSTRLKNDWSFEAPKTTDPITSDFNETDLVYQYVF
jgi:beta-glucosidase